MTVRAAQSFRHSTVSRCVTSKLEAAADVVGVIVPGSSVIVMSLGGVTLIDVITHVLSYVGPARIDVSTWSTLDADIQHAQAVLESARATRVRFLLDPRFTTNNPDRANSLRKAFGESCIVSSSSHAKFVSIRGESMNVAIRTSQNLSMEGRIEITEITESRAICDWLSAIVDACDVGEREEARPFPDDGFGPLFSRPMHLDTIITPETTHAVG